MNKLDRQALFGKISGGSNTIKIELSQRLLMEQITNIVINKSKLRLNIETLELKEITRPNIYKFGFDYTENFDGEQKYNNNKFLYNFKSTVGRGGSQTRTLREVYLFIKTQILFVNKNINTNIVFINILDGDEAKRNEDKFNYLLEKFKPDNNKIYIGQSSDFSLWFDKFNNK